MSFHFSPTSSLDSFKGMSNFAEGDLNPATFSYFQGIYCKLVSGRSDTNSLPAFCLDSRTFCDIAVKLAQKQLLLQLSLLSTSSLSDGESYRNLKIKTHKFLSVFLFPFATQFFHCMKHRQTE